MQRFKFKKGLRFHEGDCKWTLVRELATKKLELRNEMGATLHLAKNELLTRWHQGTWTIDTTCLEEIHDVIYMAEPRDLQSYGEAQQRETARRVAYLAELSALPFKSDTQALEAKIREVAEQLEDPKPPHWVTVYRWRGRYGHSQNAARLVDRRSRSGRRQNQRVFEIFQKVVDTVYLTHQKRPKTVVHEEMLLEIGAFNKKASEDQKLVAPSKPTIYRWLDDLHAYSVEAARLGKEAADKKYRFVTGTVEVRRILERVEVDHTSLDLILIDDDTKIALGRPWLTLAIDRYSRAILGFYLAFHAPSSYSVMHCLKHCILPKEEWLSDYPDLAKKWPMHGIPMAVVFDNGMDLHAQAVSKICAELGVRIVYCPTGDPYYKGAIERAFGTLNKGLIHLLPGTTFSNTKERGDYRSETEAVFGLEQAKHVITKWIVEVYHQRKHRMTGRTPQDLWDSQIERTVIELPADPRALNSLLGIPAERQRLTHEGIQFETLFYNNSDLQLLRRRIGERKSIAFKYFEEDVSYIQVWDEEEEQYVRVDVIEKYAEYARGLTRQLHLVTRRYGDSTYGKEWMSNAPLEAKREIQELVEQARKSKKMALRKKAAAFRGVAAGTNKDLLALTAALEPRPIPQLQPPPQLDPGIEDLLPQFEITKNPAPGIATLDAAPQLNVNQEK